MNKHDASYRLLFRSPAVVRGLFQGIIAAPWGDQVDWNKLAPLPTDYISDKLLQRHSDIVWRLHLIQKVYNYTKADPEVRRAFTSWLNHVLLRRSLPKVDFGPLPESVQQRLENATPEDLKTWSLALLDANSLNEVFGS